MPVMTTAEKASYDAVVAVKQAAMTLVSEAITTGTSQPLSIADATMTGLAAGGSVASTGTAGVVAVSFASAAAETNTGANQGGLGSAAASTQPYNATDFPGQHYVDCSLRTVDGDEIRLGDVLTTAAVLDLDAPVYGKLSYRSDLGANAKWRMWFYYRRAADGFETPFTPTSSVANAKLWVPVVYAITSLPVGAGLSGVSGQSAAGVVFGLVSDIAALGTAAAGASGKVADAAHVHTMPGQVLWCFGASAAAAGSATRYLQSGNHASAVVINERDGHFLCGAAGTLTKLYVFHANALSTDTVAYTVDVNDGATSITCTMAAAGTAANDTAHTAAVVAGDRVSVKTIQSASEAGASMAPRAVVMWVPT